MNMVVLNGSPRRGGNTELLVDEMLRGCGERVDACERIRVYHCNIKPCVDCRKCKQEPFECVLSDDMTGIYDKVASADVVVFGSPVYWYGPPGPMKLLIDRLRPFIANKKLRGVRAAVIAPAAEGDPACEPMLKMFEMSFSYLDMKYIGAVAAEAYEKAEVAERPAEMTKARKLGEMLCG